MLQQWIRRYEKQSLLVLSGIVGVLASLAAVALKRSVHELHYLVQNLLHSDTYSYIYYIAPAIGIALSVVIATIIGVPIAKHGITQLLYNMSKNHGFIPSKQMYAPLLTSAMTVGLGGSLGLEAPIVGSGSAIGSQFSRWTKMAYRYRVTLVGCGVAGAIAGIFNSPIAGILFVFEVVLVDMSIFQFIPLLIASVVSAITAQYLLGNTILFSFPIQEAYTLFSIKDTPYYLLLGIICGLLALLFLRMNFFIEKYVVRIKYHAIRILIGGSCLSILILILPPLYGEGYEAITALLNETPQAILSDDYPVWAKNEYLLGLFLLVTLLVKPMASGLTLGAGGNGGIFAPSLFMGAFVGYLFAKIANAFFPELQLATVPFMLAGMCGMMSGLLHAPLTAIFLIAEITHTYDLFIPLMITSALGYLSIQYFEKYSFYNKHLVESGTLPPPDNRDQRILQHMQWQTLVEKDLTIVSPDSSLAELVVHVKKSKRNIFPVVNEEGKLQGVVTLDDIREMMFDSSKQKNTNIRDLMHTPPDTIQTSEPMRRIMRKFEKTQAWNLPVIEDGKYIGIISKSRIFNEYRKNILVFMQDK